MNQEIKQRWIEALRSGEYKQGVGALKREDAFCCLGVLCDLHAKETDTSWMDDVDYKKDYWLSVYLGNDTALPNEVVNWAGLERQDPVIRSYFISTYNDKECYSFNQLADLIEKYF